ncbi:MAG: UDP-N-acetylmuramate dehydrogenase [Actinomycetota bacterium]|nr:UDP-N-acetylmuramate dehydrogenase [Actinomycetota bacterium]
MPVAAAYERLREVVHGSVRRSEPMTRHTTYRIGGPAALFVVCDTVSDIAHTLRVLSEEGVDHTVMGKGSNILVSDAGYDGAVVVLGREFKRHSVEGTQIRSGAGVILAAVVQDAFSRGFAGMEFAVGIPGTVGGALAMNAGSRDDWIGHRVENVTLFNPARGLFAVRGSEVAWGYRCTDLTYRGLIVECVLRAEDGDKERIQRTMESGLRRRKATQPLGVPCAGSVFMNPPGDSAGRLVESVGKKGACVGGARVSEVHANFIVNEGGASARDVCALIQQVRDAVRDGHGIELQTEIRFLGTFDGT